MNYESFTPNRSFHEINTEEGAWKLLLKTRCNGNKAEAQAIHVVYRNIQKGSTLHADGDRALSNSPMVC